MLPLAMLLALSAQDGGTTEEITLLPPKAKQGFYLGLGFGGAYMGVDADPVGNLGFFWGGTFHFRFGQMVNNLIGFGLAIEAGGGSSPDWGGGFGGLALETQLAPFDFDLSFRAAVGVTGFGLGRKEADQEREDDPSGGYGSYYALGVSYDWFPFYDKGDSGGFSIRSYVEARVMPLGDIIAGGAFVGGEISWYFGFGKNRLDLDVDRAFKK